VRLAHPPGDELRVLSPEVDNQNSVELAQEPKLAGDDAEGWPEGRDPDESAPRRRGNAHGWPVGRGPDGRAPEGRDAHGWPVGRGPDGRAPEGDGPVWEGP
jgi:hypothetical protein